MLASILFMVGVPFVCVFAIGTIRNYIKRTRVTKETNISEDEQERVTELGNSLLNNSNSLNVDKSVNPSAAVSKAKPTGRRR